MGRHRSDSMSSSSSGRGAKASSWDGETGHRVHVSDLAAGVSRKEIERVFSKFGTINEIWVATNPPCFAFINFKHRSDADKAIREVDGKVIGSSRAGVSWARTRTFGGRNRGSRGAAAYGSYRSSGGRRRSRSRSRSGSYHRKRRHSRSRSDSRERRHRRRSPSPRDREDRKRPRRSSEDRNGKDDRKATRSRPADDVERQSKSSRSPSHSPHRRESPRDGNKRSPSKGSTPDRQHEEKEIVASPSTERIDENTNDERSPLAAAGGESNE